MASHFECIGIHAIEPAEFAALLERLMREGDGELRPDGGDLIRWDDASGAGLVFNVDPTGRIECVTPTFRGSARRRARVVRFADHPRCPFCTPAVVEVLDAAGEGVHPMAVLFDDVGLTRGRTPFGAVVELEVVAFAEVLEVWPDESSFRAKRGAREALGTVVPTGLRSPSGPALAPEPRLTLTAAVTASERRISRATGGGFCRASVSTEVGPLALLVARWDAPRGLAPGSVVCAACWVVGRVAVAPR
jgi:hypothetical protein